MPVNVKGNEGDQGHPDQTKRKGIWVTARTLLTRKFSLISKGQISNNEEAAGSIRFASYGYSGLVVLLASKGTILVC